MNAQKLEIIAHLLGRIVIGIVLGAALTPVVGAICGLLYALVSTFGICLFAPPLWLLAVILGVLASVSWIPLGSVIGAGVALYKLRKSGNVSKGTIYIGSTILFVILALLVARWAYSHYHPDKMAIDTRYTELYESFNREDYETAYGLMTPKYRELYTLDEFRSEFGFLEGATWLILHPNRSLKLSDSKAYLYPRNRLTMEILWAGPEFELEKIEGVWYFTGEYEWYYD